MIFGYASDYTPEWMPLPNRLRCVDRNLTRFPVRRSFLVVRMADQGTVNTMDKRRSLDTYVVSAA
jgi:S-adenosylmethionine synthetase